MKFLCSFINIHNSNSKTNLNVMEDEVKRQIPQNWSEQLINFEAFIEYIQKEIKPYSIKNNGNIEVESSFIEDFNNHLLKLKSNTTNFLNSINETTSKFNTFFLQQINLLTNSSIKAEEKVTAARSLKNIQSILYLTFFKFAVLLDKFDNASGLSFGDSLLNYIIRQYSVFNAETSEKIDSATRSVKYSDDSENENDNSRNYEMNILSTTESYSNILKQIFAILQEYKVNVRDFQIFKSGQNDVSVSLILDINFQFIEMYNKINEIINTNNGSISVRALGNKTLLVKNEKGESNEDKVSYKNYVATLINKEKLDSEFLNHWFQFLSDNKIIIKSVKRLNRATEPNIRVMDVFLDIPNEADIAQLKKQIFELTSTYKTDIALQVDDVYRKNKRLIVFDMDSTLIQQEVIDEIARHAGVVKEVSAITASAMNGEINFQESLARRVALLKGLSVNIFEEIKKVITFTPGAHKLCKTLKNLGYKLAVCSGGFVPLANYIKNELGLDFAYANNLAISEDGTQLEGKTYGPIVDGSRKAELLGAISQLEHLIPEQTIAVGDGANDLLMMSKAGLGVAFNAKPRVQEQAPTRINQPSLDNVLYLLGYTDEEISTILKY
ncbi:HAD-like domain-containing protein [Neocallimastix lanati (nom. inval.)]|nr:HAD-like domain-containing protein [Neocallimastix sp. JGI-2020a]